MAEHDSAWFDRMYNNRELVPAYGEHFRRWAQDSAAARPGLGGALDVRYGPGPRQVLDVFPARPGRPAPVLFFIHGGYWRALDKSDHSFVAPTFVREGACVVMPNYDLCPAVTVPDIVMQMVRALEWTWRNVARWGGDPSRITVAGHSAGGHLAAMMLACAWPAASHGLPRDLVKRALSISGLHDLEPIRRTTFLQPSLRLTAGHVERASPARLPPPAHGKLCAFAGADESEEFARQNRLIRDAWGSDVVPVCELLPGKNHFTALEALVEPANRLATTALELVFS